MSNVPTAREVADIKFQYPPGIRIELERMVDAYTGSANETET